MKRITIIAFYIGYSVVSFVASILPTLNDINDILKTHNDIRANVRPPSNAMMQLTWNHEAALRANYAVGPCVFAHNAMADRLITGYINAGQNIYATSLSYGSWVTVIHAWASEVRYFRFDTVNKAKQVGHYTQLVWGSTKEIGCAYRECPFGMIYLCNYYPSGNVGSVNEPYQRALKASCKGCLINGTCITKGAYANRLLKTCDLFCVDKYSNCQALAKKMFCMKSEKKCPKSCRPECKVPDPYEETSSSPEVSTITEDPSYYY